MTQEAIWDADSIREDIVALKLAPKVYQYVKVITLRIASIFI